MTSRRFPGKVLAPFHGKPVVRHVLDAVGGALPSIPVIVATSVEEADDPLTTYLESSGFTVFRGPLDDVLERFRCCAAQHPCDWILRLSADSPLLDMRLLQAVSAYSDNEDCDLVTTIFPRTFPSGRNAELIRVRPFMKIDARELNATDREHVTAFYYRNQERFRIANVRSNNPKLAEVSLTIDTVEDLHRLQQLSKAELRELSYDGLASSPI